MKKPLVYALTALMVITTAEAKKNNGNNAATKEAAKEAQKKKEKEKEDRDKKREAVKKYLDAKDKNNDGSLSLDEFLTGESDVPAATKRFTDHNKNKDRYLSKDEIAEMLGL